MRNSTSPCASLRRGRAREELRSSLASRSASTSTLVDPQPRAAVTLRDCRLAKCTASRAPLIYFGSRRRTPSSLLAPTFHPPLAPHDSKPRASRQQLLLFSTPSPSTYDASSPPAPSSPTAVSALLALDRPRLSPAASARHVDAQGQYEQGDARAHGRPSFCIARPRRGPVVVAVAQLCARGRRRGREAPQYGPQHGEQGCDDGERPRAGWCVPAGAAVEEVEAGDEGVELHRSAAQGASRASSSLLSSCPCRR